ncbi:GPN-loop GTPase 2 like protein [Verticillium longisporum]|nr:GPN-loop GTPase 2 like protein [Verticillium longisporum]
MPFAQLVLGSPGAGKSTYCDGMHQFLSAIGRACSVVNLDPANENANYPKAIDIRSIAKLEDIMARDRLGPNGGILYALEELEHNIDWLEEGLKELGDDYVIFDCPGQVELYTHHSSLRNIFLRLQKLGYRLGYRLVVVHLSDSFCLTQPSLYISNLLLSLRAMLQMDLPHINVLSKIDKVASYDPLPFNLDFYTDVQDVSYLMPYLEEESPVMRNDKFGRLNEAVANMIESYGLVRFEVLAVENKKSMMHLLRVIDRAGGYVFGTAEGANDTVWQVAMRNESSMLGVLDIQERWVDQKADYDRLEQEEELLREGAEQRSGEDLSSLHDSQGFQGSSVHDPDFGDMNVPANSGVKVVRKT